MNSRFLPAKLFFATALVCAVVGVALFRRGLPLDMYLNPVALLVFPGLIPFALAIVSAVFGVICHGIEKDFRRSLSVPLTLAQIAFMLAAAWGHLGVIRFWDRTLTEGQAANLPFPFRSSWLFLSGIVISLAIFALNMARSSRAVGGPPS